MTSSGAPDFASGISTTTLFSNLLEQSRKLRQETEAADLPAIQLGLGELERRAKDLRRGTQTTEDARAYATHSLSLLNTTNLGADATFSKLVVSTSLRTFANLTISISIPPTSRQSPPPLSTLTLTLTSAPASNKMSLRVSKSPCAAPPVISTPS